MHLFCPRLGLTALLYVFAASVAPCLQAGELTLAQAFDPDLIPKDTTTRSFWGKQGRLYERVGQPTSFILQQRDAETGKVTTLASGEQMAEAFKRLPGFARVTPNELYDFDLAPDENDLLFYLGHDYFLFNLSTLEAQRLTFSPRSKVGEAFSPDGEYLAYVEAHNLWLVEVKSKRVRQLTFDGNDKLLYGRLDWVYQEEVFGRGNFKGYWWSPDSQHLAFFKIDEAGVGAYPLVDDMSAPYAELQLVSYPKAGTPNPVVEVGVIAARGGEPLWLDLSSYERGSYLVVGLGFSPDGRFVNLQVQDRSQSFLDLLLYPIEGGKPQLLVHEASSDWVNRLQEEPLWDGQGFFWLSERTGFAHLYHYTLSPEHEVTNVKALTDGEWDVLKLFHVNGDDIYLAANKSSSLEDQLYHVNRQSQVVSQLTPSGLHHAASFAPSGTYALLSAETIAKPKNRSLVRLRGATLTEQAKLFEPDVSKLAALGLQDPEFLNVPARDGYHLNALLIKPRGFDESAQYPVLTQVYAGPRTPLVRNEFRPRNYLWHQLLAQKGYVIWLCDNRSAIHRGHGSEAVVHKRLGVQELADIEEGIAFLKRNQWVNADRLGIWGWSFGGFQTAYALTHSQTFKAGIAVAPVTDWRLYDSIYTERYMSTPQANPEGYRCSSVLGCARQLQGKKFLLVHGTLDDNVHVQNSLQFSFELQDAGIDFDQMLYPASDHGIPRFHRHLYEKMTKFVLEHI